MRFPCALPLVALTAACAPGGPVEAAPVNTQAPTRPGPSAGETLRLGWGLRLEQPIRQLEEVLQEQMTQQGMNFTSANVAFLKDALVRERALEAMSRLPRGERDAFAAEQLAWRENKLQAAQAAAAEYEGGSIAPLMANSESISWSNARLEWLDTVGR